MPKNIVQLIKLATEAVSDVPENLKEIAFSKAFDALLEEEKSTLSIAAHKTKRPQLQTASDPAILTDKSNNTSLDQIDRTAHPEIDPNGTALENSLKLLLAVREDLGIEGLTSREITDLLSTKFNFKRTKKAIYLALNNASQYVDRIENNKNGTIKFKITSLGEEKLKYTELVKNHMPKLNASSQKLKRKTGIKKNKNSVNSTLKLNSPSGKPPSAFKALTQLYESEFFSKPRSVTNILQTINQIHDHTYKQKELSPVILRFLYSKKLMKIKNSNNQYEYINA